MKPDSRPRPRLVKSIHGPVALTTIRGLTSQVSPETSSRRTTVAARGALRPHVIQRARPGTCGFGVLNQFQAQPFRIGDFGVVVSGRADHFGVESGPQRERRPPEAEPVFRQRGLAAGQKVVPHQTGLDEQRSPIARLGGPSQQIPDGRNNPGRPTEDRNRRGQRLDVVGRVLQQPVSLPEGLAHQAEFRVLQIAEAAVNDARHGGAGSGAEVGPVDQQDIDSLQRQLGEQADSIDAAANDQNGNIGVISKRGKFWPHRGSEGTQIVARRAPRSTRRASPLRTWNCSKGPSPRL